jgi:GntR family transcriptional regulator
MDFNDNKAIYLQIAGMIYEKILSGEWKPLERIPAVRELSVTLEVNPNTVMRTYQLLEGMNVINLKRGTGFYLNEGAYDIVFATMKDDFLKNQLPVMFRSTSLLRISPGEIKKMYEDYLNGVNHPGQNDIK